ncbi:TIGR04452 family lipoprotein [Leptospira fletcheri]|uniref:TIGR04452 family lipoprotein n=1 Tax=Leptospira fletcheri TaxID=2484981 RepID=A0A4R9GFT3_9LEPT|nr:TIGR04452 family lipoprotein [Leptospira fletcheri]TGK11488.1 TIGR04452 family lipoprotein [Leptospira fletcheri]
MKRIFPALLPIFFFANCYLIDKVGITIPEKVKGDEAKNRIVTSAVIGASVSPNSSSIIALVSYQLANVDESKYYNKTDVDNCANRALLINLSELKIGGFDCNLEADKLIVPYIY